MKPHAYFPTLSFAALLVGAPLAFAQTSVQSGNWSTGSIWSTGTIPTSPAVTIDGPHTVTAGSGVSLSNTNSNGFVYGTLNVTDGASITMRRINSGADSREGARTVNIDGGGYLSMEFGSGTYNVGSGGRLQIRGNSIAAGNININGGGTVTVSQGGTSNQIYNLNGGHLIYENGLLDIGVITWTGGTVVSNGSHTDGLNHNRLNRFLTGLNNNTANVWDLSDKTSKQTFTGTNNGAYTVSQGTVQFDIYSPADNDQIVMNGGSSARINFTADVTFHINGVNLLGSAGDYVGSTYQLFDYASGTYSGILASISSTVWTIDGQQYDVAFTNTLATNGSITVASLTLSAVPEPSTLALLAGLGTLGFAALRRRR